MSHAFFVTGTDTDAGKTVVAAGLLAAGNALGITTLGLKPVAAGGLELEGEIRNEDALMLQQTASCKLEYHDINPIALRDAIAPHVAAAREGRELDMQKLAAHCHQQRERTTADLVVAEGAGGWLVPLAGTDTMADLAAAVGWPVILVVAMRLGCLNHAMLSAAAIEQAGLALAGWVATTTGTEMAAYDENIATLDERLRAPRIGTLPYLGADPTPGQAADHLDLQSLLASGP